jgi:pimeloyl-ACP methyl ester carboxylesterase
MSLRMVPEQPTQIVSPRTVQVNAGDGVQLYVDDHGTRTARHTVVFLHGLCLDKTSWTSHVGYLLRRYRGIRVINYDHRGHGQSGSAPMSTYRIDQLADDLAHVLVALNVSGPTTFVAHSMGGMAALSYLGRPAAKRPVDPHGLVLVATAAGHLTARGLGRLIATPVTGALFGLVAHTPDRALRTAAGPVCSALNLLCGRGSGKRQTLAAVTAAALTTTPVATAVGFLPSLRSYDQYRVLGSIRARTIVVSGGADLLTPSAHSAELAAAIPGSVHMHLPDAGHMLPQQAPQILNDAIRHAMAAPAWPEHRQHRNVVVIDRRVACQTAAGLLGVRRLTICDARRENRCAAPKDKSLASTAHADRRGNSRLRKPSQCG